MFNIASVIGIQWVSLNYRQIAQTYRHRKVKSNGKFLILFSFSFFQMKGWSLELSESRYPSKLNHGQWKTFTFFFKLKLHLRIRVESSFSPSKYDQNVTKLMCMMFIAAKNQLSRLQEKLLRRIRNWRLNPRRNTNKWKDGDKLEKVHILHCN